MTRPTRYPPLPPPPVFLPSLPPALLPQSKENLSALLKHIYRQLFAWINWKINFVFAGMGAKGIGSSAADTDRTFIGILDIFGEAEPR